MDNQLKEYFSQMGKKGGSTTREKHPDHFKRISALGVEARRLKKQEQEKTSGK